MVRLLCVLVSLFVLAEGVPPLNASEEAGVVTLQHGEVLKVRGWRPPPWDLGFVDALEDSFDEMATTALATWSGQVVAWYRRAWGVITLTASLQGVEEAGGFLPILDVRRVGSITRMPAVVADVLIDPSIRTTVAWAWWGNTRSVNPYCDYEVTVDVVKDSRGVERGVGGALSNVAVEVRWEYKRFHYFGPLLAAVGLVLWVAAPQLATSSVAFLAMGTTLGGLVAFVFLLLVAWRLRKSAIVWVSAGAAMIGGAARSLLRGAQPGDVVQLDDMLQRSTALAWGALAYLTVASLSVFVYLYVRGPLENPRATRALAVALRVLSICIILLSTTSVRLSAPVVGLLLGGMALFTCIATIMRVVWIVGRRGAALCGIPTLYWKCCRCCWMRCRRDKRLLSREAYLEEMERATHVEMLKLQQLWAARYAATVSRLSDAARQAVMGFTFHNADDVDLRGVAEGYEVEIAPDGTRIDPREIETDEELVAAMEEEEARLSYEEAMNSSDRAESPWMSPSGMLRQRRSLSLSASRRRGAYAVPAPRHSSEGQAWHQ